MKIEFDENKRIATFEIRGLYMARAAEIPNGPTLTVEDNRKNYGEHQYISVGFLNDVMVIVV